MAHAGKVGAWQKELESVEDFQGQNAVFSHYTRHTYDFQSGGPSTPFDTKEYLGIVCKGICRHLVPGGTSSKVVNS